LLLFLLPLLFMPTILSDVPLSDPKNLRSWRSLVLLSVPTSGTDSGVDLSAKELRAHRPRRLDDDKLALDLIPPPPFRRRRLLPPKRTQARCRKRTVHGAQPHRQLPMMWSKKRRELLEEWRRRQFRVLRFRVKFPRARAAARRTVVTAVLQQDAQTAFFQTWKIWTWIIVALALREEER
jgi:hypothetical protein